jgi:hypothetical protein
MPAAFHILVALEAYIRDPILEHSNLLPGVSFVAVTAIVLGGLMPVFAAEEGIVTVQAVERLFGWVGVRIVAFIAVRFEQGRMDHRTCFLLLVAKLTCCCFLNDGEQGWLQGAVRVVTSLTFVSKGDLVVLATLPFRVALETERRNFIGEMIFKVRTVGDVAVVTAFLGCGMIVSGVHYP